MDWNGWQRASLAEPHVPLSRTYRLKFAEDGSGLQKDVEFEALDAAAALRIAQNEAINRVAELWCDGRKLCTIRRSRHNVWEVNAT